MARIAHLFTRKAVKAERTPVKRIADLRIVMRDFSLINGEAVFKEEKR